jgi:hypothetical protein
MGPISYTNVTFLLDRKFKVGMSWGQMTYPFAGRRVLHLSTILASFILLHLLGVIVGEYFENLGKAFKLALRCISVAGEGIACWPKGQGGYGKDVSDLCKKLPTITSSHGLRRLQHGSEM